MKRIQLDCLLLLMLGALAAEAQLVNLSSQQLSKCSSLDGLKSLAKELKQGGSISISSPDEAAQAAQLWIWGYPLTQMAPATYTTGIKFDSINKAYQQSSLVDVSNQYQFGIVTPNADTLYTTSWLDLSAGPVVLTAPASGGRYYVLQLLDYYTNVIGNPGSLTTGTGPGKFVILPPGLTKAQLPAEYQTAAAIIPSNTTAVWLLGRTFVAGQADLAAAQAFQRGITVTPIKLPAAQLTRPVVQPGSSIVSTTQAAVKLLQESKLSFVSIGNATTAFAAVMGVARAYPPAQGLGGPLALALPLGLSVDKGFSQPPLSPKQQAILDQGWLLGQSCISTYGSSGAMGIALKYGWTFPNKAGLFGQQFLLRAAVALVGLGANSPQAAIYIKTDQDKAGQALSGASGAVYTVTFDAPVPAQGFWSLTVYDTDNKMLPSAGAAINRSVINPKATPGLKMSSLPGDKEALTVWVSNKPPGPAGSVQYTNWLPMGPGPTYAILRLYGPSNEAVAGKYQPPPFVKVN